MEITLIIVAGVTLMTIVTVVGDYFSKKRKLLNTDALIRLQDLEKKVHVLEARQTEKDERIAQLEEEVTFVNRLLENKTVK